MALQLGDVEKRLRSLIEVHLTKYLPGPTYQDRIAQRLSEVLQTSLATQKKNIGEKSPSDFALAIHPSTLNQWNKEPLLIDGITKIFRLMASELGLQSESPLKLSIITDPMVEIDDLQIRALKNVSVAETQEKDNDANDSALPSKPAFLIVGGTKVFSIQTTVTNIGRRLDNHLVVNDPRVSRYHAQIRCARGRFLIFDLNSTGGTYVNGQRTSQSVLYPGDVISLAGLPIIFGQDNPPMAAGSTGTAPLTPITSERHTAVLRDLGKKEQ